MILSYERRTIKRAFVNNLQEYLKNRDNIPSSLPIWRMMMRRIRKTISRKKKRKKRKNPKPAKNKNWKIRKNKNNRHSRETVIKMKKTKTMSDR